MVAVGGMIVTDGRVLLASELEEFPELTVIPREIRIDAQTLRSDDRIKMIRSLVREATNHNRKVRVLPPQREHFLPVYQALGEHYEQLISMHLMGTFDQAAREARICRQLMQPSHQIHVYEAKTLEGGLEFLLRTALDLAKEGANVSQLLTLLRYLETHMLTFLLAMGSCPSQPWVEVSGPQRVRSMMPSMETLWFFDPKQNSMQVISQARDLHSQVGPLLQQRWGPLRYRVLARYRGYNPQQVERLRSSLSAAGVSEVPRFEPMAATFLPGFPQQCIELLFLPTESDLQRLYGLIQDLVWWKGAA